jgi:hypothetical protein
MAIIRRVFSAILASLPFAGKAVVVEAPEPQIMILDLLGPGGVRVPVSRRLRGRTMEAGECVTYDPHNPPPEWKPRTKGDFSVGPTYGEDGSLSVTITYAR